MTAPIPPSKTRALLAVVVNAAMKVIGDKAIPETMVVMDHFIH